MMEKWKTLMSVVSLGISIVAIGLSFFTFIFPYLNAGKRVNLQLETTSQIVSRNLENCNPPNKACRIFLNSSIEMNNELKQTIIREQQYLTYKKYLQIAMGEQKIEQAIADANLQLLIQEKSLESK